MNAKFFTRYKHIILYGVSLAALLFLLQFLQYKLLLIDHSFELYIFAIALLFTVFGIWLAKKLTKPKVVTEVRTVTVEKEIIKTVAATNAIDIDAIEQIGLSSREVEVLQAMAEGCSNAEIADRLFISLNTVKTHSARLFEKLEVKRRTQAVEKAKRLNLIR